jgi:hypothetical protein
MAKYAMHLSSTCCVERHGLKKSCASIEVEDCRPDKPHSWEVVPALSLGYQNTNPKQQCRASGSLKFC